MADYISREEAIETIQYRVCQGHGNKELICKRGSCAYCGIMEVMSDISSIEAADVQPISHGRWENEYLDDDDVWWADCTNCNNDAHSRFGKVSIYAYCPNCGARMDGEQNDT